MENFKKINMDNLNLNKIKIDIFNIIDIHNLSYSNKKDNENSHTLICSYTINLLKETETLSEFFNTMLSQIITNWYDVLNKDTTNLLKAIFTYIRLNKVYTVCSLIESSEISNFYYIYFDNKLFAFNTDQKEKDFFFEILYFFFHKHGVDSFKDEIEKNNYLLQSVVESVNNYFVEQ